MHFYVVSFRKRNILDFFLLGVYFPCAQFSFFQVHNFGNFLSTPGFLALQLDMSSRLPQREINGRGGLQ